MTFFNHNLKVNIKLFFSVSVLLSAFSFLGCSAPTDVVVDNAPAIVTYTVTFDGQDAGVPTLKTVTSPATTLDALPPVPVKTENTFGGWFTQANGAGDEFLVTTPVMADLTVYAKWTPNPYTVFFDSNGGTGNMPELMIGAGTSQNLSSNLFTHSVHNFVGWNTEADGSGTAYPEGANFTMSSGDVTLFAQWTKTLTLDVNGGTGVNIYYELANGVTITLPAMTSTKTGSTIFYFSNYWVDYIGMRYFAYQSSFTMGSSDVILKINWFRTAR